MTFLSSTFAAIVATVIWYKNAPKNKMKVGTLALIFWGASLMWLADLVSEYAKIGAAVFSPEPAQLLNDLYLGLFVVALGLIIWLVILLIKDPKKLWRK